MFKKNRFTGPPADGFYQEPMHANYQADRIMYEIKENRRRINNLAKRIIRLENYLRIKDTSDYSIIEDEDPNNPFYQNFNQNKPN